MKILGILYESPNPNYSHSLLTSVPKESASSRPSWRQWKLPPGIQNIGWEGGWVVSPDSVLAYHRSLVPWPLPPLWRALLQGSSFQWALPLYFRPLSLSPWERNAHHQVPQPPCLHLWNLWVEICFLLESRVNSQGMCEKLEKDHKLEGPEIAMIIFLVAYTKFKDSNNQICVTCQESTLTIGTVYGLQSSTLSANLYCSVKFTRI